METVLRSKGREVTIGADRPFVVIGERINPTGRKKLAAALEAHRLEVVQELAQAQVEAGADVLDVNVGAAGVDERALLPEAVRLVAEIVDVPLCLDSADREALAAALAVAPGKPLVNSVSGEPASLERVLPVVREFGAAVIGLTLDEGGIPPDAEKRLAIAGRILEYAARIGIPAENVIIDPLVLTVGADSQAARVTLETIELVRREFGVNLSLGASNVSFGLPERPTINQAFLTLGIAAGATCAITDPAKLTPTIRATDLLLGRDPYAARFIQHWRSRASRGVDQA